MLELVAFVLIIYMLNDVRNKIASPVTGVKKYNNSIVLDTSALIDGRILVLLKQQYLQCTVLVPSVVLFELQKIADFKGVYDRRRALSGLENLKILQNTNNLDIKVLDTKKNVDEPVDNQILSLALENNAGICTTDVGLQKLAELKGCRVLNLNELASSMRLKVFAGDTLSIRIISKGESKSQGVGYTDDGCMVVVEQAASLTGQTIDVVVKKTLQTTTGQTIFAKISRS